MPERTAEAWADGAAQTDAPDLRPCSQLSLVGWLRLCADHNLEPSARAAGFDFLTALATRPPRKVTLLPRGVPPATSRLWHTCRSPHAAATHRPPTRLLAFDRIAVDHC